MLLSNAAIVKKNGLEDIYDPDVKSELLDQFLNNFTLNDTGKRQFLQEYCGMILLGDNKEHIGLNLNGTECNGKTTFISLLDLLGSKIKHFNTNPSIRNVSVVVFDHPEKISSSAMNRLLATRYVIIESNTELVLPFNMVTIPCGAVFTNNHVNRSYYLQKDCKMGEKLKDPEVVSATLNWLLEGAQRVQHCGLKNYKTYQ